MWSCKFELWGEAVVSCMLRHIISKKLDHAPEIQRPAYNHYAKSIHSNLTLLAVRPTRLQWYKTVIQPLIENACPVRHSSLTVDELRTLEAIQKHAIRIITEPHDYESYCSLYHLEQVNNRLDILTRHLYTQILKPNGWLYKMLTRRELEYIPKLRIAKEFDLLCRMSRNYWL